MLPYFSGASEESPGLGFTDSVIEDVANSRSRSITMRPLFEWGSEAG